MPDIKGIRAGVLLLAAQFPGQSHAEVLDAAVRAALAAGRAFTFGGVPVVPRPRTRPHPPLVVACTSAATAALAAARGLPMLLGMHAGDDGKRELIGSYAAAAPPGQQAPAGHIAAVVA